MIKYCFLNGLVSGINSATIFIEILVMNLYFNSYIFLKCFKGSPTIDFCATLSDVS